MLRTYGVAGLKAYIRNHLRLGELFHELVLSRKDLFRVPFPPAFALTTLVVVPKGKFGGEGEGMSRPGVSDGLEKGEKVLGREDGLMEANRITKAVYELINSMGEFFLTSGVVNGIYVIRVLSANPKAEEKYIRRVFEVLIETAEEVLARADGEKGRR